MLSWFVFLLCLPALAATETKLEIKEGQPFPDLVFDGLMHEDDYRKIGLERTEGAVAISEIDTNFLIIEFFNKSCVPCQRQVREMEAYYKMISTEASTPKLRVLAVAVGNKAKYLGRYRKKRGLSYPIATDPEFEQWKRMGEPGKTPFIVFLRKDPNGWVLHGMHFGIHNKDELEKLGENLLSGSPPPVENEGETPDWLARHLEMPLSETQLASMAQALLKKAAGKQLDTETVILGNGMRLFRATDPASGKTFYARPASRPPVCEVCHAVHFMYAFDEMGTVLAYESIHVTKYGNIELNDNENEHLDRQLNGRKLATLDFDPDVDAVTQATMSTALIFDEIRRTREILDELRQLQ